MRRAVVDFEKLLLIALDLALIIAGRGPGKGCDLCMFLFACHVCSGTAPDLRFLALATAQTVVDRGVRGSV